MIRKSYPLRDGEISAVHIGDIRQPARLLFCHANGFNGLANREILEPLGVHCIAIDMRGHGRSNLPTFPETLKDWHVFRDDIAEFAARHIEGNFALAGHSFGGISAILAAPQLKDRLTGYVGFDPVSMPRYIQRMATFKFWREGMKKHVPIARGAGRRRSVFESFDFAFDRYQGRGAFKGVPDQILRDYLTDGLTETADGMMRLSCAPEWEQAIFVAQNNNPYRAAKALPKNSHIIYGGKGGSVSTPSTRLRMRLAQPAMKVEYRKDLAHLFPFQNPDIAITTLKAMLKASESVS